MIMNAAFLVERERESEFDRVVNKIARKYGSASSSSTPGRGRLIILSTFG